MARRLLAVSFVIGMVLALLAAAFAPAISGSVVVVRVLAGIAGAGCLVGLVLLGRPQPSTGAPGARPICPQCGNDLTEIPAEASGRTTCPACELTWAFGRDKAVWREEAPPARALTDDPPARVRSPVVGRIPGTRARRRASRKAAATWTLVLFGYIVVCYVLLPLGLLLTRTNISKYFAPVFLISAVLIPLVIMAAGVWAVCRAGRSVAAQPCPSCGYDLTGLDRTKPGGVACPECGGAV